MCKQYNPAIAGFPQERALLGDIDGDGRLDYCVLNDNQDIQCFRNGGMGEMAGPWEDLGVVFTGKGLGDFRGFRLGESTFRNRPSYLLACFEFDANV